MEETLTAGTKEFVFSIIWAIILLTVGKYITFLLPGYKIIGTLITILMFCVLAFFVLTRYCAVYTYSLKDGRLIASRAIGHRVKETVVYVSNISSVTGQKPTNKVKNVYTMRKSVFSDKNTLYVLYSEKGAENMLVFEPTKKLKKELKAQVKSSGKH